MDDFLQELDEDVEGMQSTIIFLQQELKTSKDTINSLEREMNLLRNGAHHNATEENDEDGHTGDLLDDDDDHENVITGADASSKGGRRHNRLPKANTNNGNSVSTNSPSAVLTTAAAAATGTSTVVPVCIGNGADSGQILVNGISSSGGAIITNCSVKLRVGDKINSERILRKEKINSISTNQKVNEPRTLRSSRRNVSTDDLRTTKFNNKKHVYNGNHIDDDNDIEGNNVNNDIDEDDDDDDCIIGGSTNDRVIDSNSLEHKFNSNKRTYDDSDSSECSSETEMNTTAPTGTGVSSLAAAPNNNTNLKTIIKKVRRSSVLSLDLNEEDSQIDIDDERTIVVSSNGTKGGRNVD